MSRFINSGPIAGLGQPLGVGALRDADATRNALASNTLQVVGPLDSVQSALALARDLGFRANALADRLLGVPPRCAGDSGEQEPAGVLPKMQSDAERTAVFLREGLESLARIEKALS